MDVNWSGLPPNEMARRAHAAATSRSLEELSGLLDTYLEGKEASPSTRQNYKSRLKLVIQYLEEKDVDMLNPSKTLGKDFIRDMSRLEFSTSTIKAYTTAFRSLYEALAWLDVVRFDPFFGVDVVKLLSEAGSRR